MMRILICLEQSVVKGRGALVVLLQKGLERLVIQVGNLEVFGANLLPSSPDHVEVRNSRICGIARRYRSVRTLRSVQTLPKPLQSFRSWDFKLRSTIESIEVECGRGRLPIAGNSVLIFAFWYGGRKSSKISIRFKMTCRVTDLKCA